MAPSFSTVAHTDGNRRLRSEGGPTAFATVANGRFEAVYTHPTYSVTLKPAARFSRYTECPELTAEDWFVDLVRADVHD